MAKKRKSESPEKAAKENPSRATAAGGDVLAAHVYLRGLGLVYFFAFLSLWVQAEGLFGSRGILPMTPYLSAAQEHLGQASFWRLPTLFWLGSSDLALNLVCLLGLAAGLAVLAGRLVVPALIIAWASSLSLVTVGREFLGFQWDSLLLEAGFLTIFLFPPALKSPFGVGAPASWPLWLLRFLLFRLMVSSGLVKLLSGDATWRELSALSFHYETQPLPTWLGWWAHQLPASWQAFSVAMMFAIELVVPLLIFAPARWRRFAFPPFLLLQVLIATTGNYGFFNVLSLLLATLTMSDSCFPRRLRAKAHVHKAGLVDRTWRLTFIPVGTVVALLALLTFAATLRVLPNLPEPLRGLWSRAAPLRSVNSYGLFAVMTQERLEIVIEGSRDGREWRAYDFSFKPSDAKQRPAFAAPHMPRLDWQMWFAALGQAEQNPWFYAFLRRLGEGSPTVLELLARNPFPEGPPAFLRARLERYRFTDRPTRAQTGQWWRREEAGVYLQQVAVEKLLIEEFR